MADQYEIWDRYPEEPLPEEWDPCRGVNRGKRPECPECGCILEDNFHCPQCGKLQRE